MSVAHIATAVLLGVGVAAAAVSAAGILLMRDFYERLHYLGPAGTVGAAAIAAALLLQGPLSAASLKVILVVLLLGISNPVLTHATARAGRVHELGDWKPKRGEGIEREEGVKLLARGRHKATPRRNHGHSGK